MCYKKAVSNVVYAEGIQISVPSFKYDDIVIFLAMYLISHLVWL
jgi:hypothetical protein